MGSNKIKPSNNTLRMAFIFFLMGSFIVGAIAYSIAGKPLFTEGLDAEEDVGTEPESGTETDVNAPAPGMSPAPVYMHAQHTHEVSSPVCPDLLIKRDNTLLLFKTKQPVVQNVNPMTFHSMDEYIIYVEGKRATGQRCPVLYLQEETDVQSKSVYRVRPDVFSPEGSTSTSDAMGNPLSIPIDTPLTEISKLVDASRQNTPYNANTYPGFDAHGLHVGKYNVLDQIHEIQTKNEKSDNPMDPNWGGVLYSKHQVASGKYAENEIVKPTYDMRSQRYGPPLTSTLPL